MKTGVMDEILLLQMRKPRLREVKQLGNVTQLALTGTELELNAPQQAFLSDARFASCFYQVVLKLRVETNILWNNF